MNRNIFISYSHKDLKWLTEMQKHLSVLKHNHQLDIWDDSKIKIGGNWRESIEVAINNSKVAILLVSANFLESDFISRQELPQILLQAQNSGLTIFNIIVDTCAFHLTALEKFQSFNNPSFPIEEMKPRERNRVFVNLATDLLKTIDTQHSVQAANNMESYSKQRENQRHLYLRDNCASGDSSNRRN